MTNTETSLTRQEVEHSDLLVDNFLAHYGVKGMKWGVRRKSTGSSSKSSSKKSSTSTVNRDAAKVVGKEVAKVAVRYGLPVGAAALGAGIPLVATLGVSAKVLDDPAVQAALAPVGKAVKSMSSHVGSLKMSDLPKLPDPTAGVRNWMKEAKATEAALKRSIAQDEATIKKVEDGRAAFNKSVQDSLAESAKKQAEITAIETQIEALDREEAELRR